MAEETDNGSKTEDATPRRLEQARKEGDVPKSADLAQVCALAGAFGVIALGGGALAHGLADNLLPFIAHPEAIDLKGSGQTVAWQVALAAAPALLAVLGATSLAGIGGNVIQQGMIFTTAKIKPDLSKLSISQGFKRVFGIDGLMNTLRSALKVLLVSAVAWWVLAPHAGDLPRLVRTDPASVLTYSAGLSRSLMFAVLALLAAGALIDFIWQRQRFMNRMKMTKEQVKEDFRQSEGDPHVKARQRQIRNERARRRMIQQVPKATVVIANPTHFAVALRYEQGETPAPQCVAKGMDAVALRIREIAEAHGVPVIEDPPLARALFASMEVDQIIPHQHYEAVAKIIGFILAGKRGRTRARAL
ncbi:MAG TPA: flagellar biosynthesis protein FlhB [Caulobacteraceae bacterium]|nr:flagellar biosynthesis protein FlhB [Caulobacteraceae bacterium]